MPLSRVVCIGQSLRDFRVPLSLANWVGGGGGGGGGRGGGATSPPPMPAHLSEAILIVGVTPLNLSTVNASMME